MNFITPSFVCFFLLFLPLWWGWQRFGRLSALLLLAAGLFFYVYAVPVYLLLLLGVALAAWGTVKLTERCTGWLRTAILGADVALHVLLLAFFKYYERFLQVVLDVGGTEAHHLFFNATLSELVFPVGLSFFSFQGLSYAIDHYRDPQLPRRSFLQVLTYLSFFPTVMAGPIMRSEDFLTQLSASNRRADGFAEGAALILNGLFKKVVLATYLASHAVDPVYGAELGSYSGSAVLLATYAYSIQIFCDFSGYTDIAIGIGRLMGFRLPQNFNSPYLAVNLQDFWRRWHITLSLWLRDYVYIPLGGNRRGNRYLNVIITMIVGGLWHGSGLNFLIWGLLHGVGQAVSLLFRKLTGSDKAPQTGVWAMAHRIVAIVITFHFVTLAWVFFRCADTETALAIIRRACSPAAEGQMLPVLVFPAVVLAFLLQLFGGRLFNGFRDVMLRLPWPVQATCCALLGMLIMNMGPDGALPFIYFSF